eukprot:GHVU01058432.1.p1 GENE.GHVU01058432.1~~GHVU01058432.1.p1  ORF type:complete len:350 (-),score=28.14 GHVU01058432.1:159-1208(-)
MSHCQCASPLSYTGRRPRVHTGIAGRAGLRPAMIILASGAHRIATPPTRKKLMMFVGEFVKVLCAIHFALVFYQASAVEPAPDVLPSEVGEYQPLLTNDEGSHWIEKRLLVTYDKTCLGQHQSSEQNGRKLSPDEKWKRRNVSASRVSKAAAAVREAMAQGHSIDEALNDFEKESQDTSGNKTPYGGEFENAGLLTMSYLDQVDIDIVEVPSFLDSDSLLKIVQRVATCTLDVSKDRTKMPAFDGDWNDKSDIVEANDGLFDRQWYLHESSIYGLRLDKAWRYWRGPTDESTGMVVAVLDTGFRNHTDLIGRIWTNPDEVCGDGIDNDGNGYVDDCHGYVRVQLSSCTE